FVKGRGTAFAKAVFDAHFAEILGPLKLAGQVVGIEAVRAEVSEHVLAVRDSGVGGEGAVSLANAFVRNFLAGDFLPQDFARLPIQCHESELIDFGRLLSAAEAAATATS